jgi:hypothetical protein
MRFFSVMIIHESFFRRIKVNVLFDMMKNMFFGDLDGAIRLHREVVLITDDRNLRLKAQARNVPVKDLMKFLELAQVNLEK